MSAKKDAVAENIEPLNKEGIFFKRHGKGGLEEDVNDKFDVTVPTGFKVAVFVMIAVFGAIQYYYMKDILAVVVFALISFVPLMLWATVGPKIAELSILKWVTKKKQGKALSNAIETFAGFPVTLKDPYYIEANPVDLDMSKIATIIKRIQEVVFLSIGICVLLAQTLGPRFFGPLRDFWAALGEPYSGPADFIIDTTIWLGPFAMFILFLVMPLFWIAEDCQIYRVDAQQDIHRLGEYLRTGILSKVLGFFGIVLAFDVCKTYAIEQSLTGPSVYIVAFSQMALLILASAGPAFLVSSLYVIYIHEVWVNNVRIKASAYIPSCTFRVHYAPASELEFLTHPEKLKDTQSSKVIKFLNSGAGLAISIVVSLATMIFSFFLGFIFTGDWTQPIPP